MTDTSGPIRISRADEQRGKPPLSTKEHVHFHEHGGGARHAHAHVHGQPGADHAHSHLTKTPAHEP